MRFSHGLLAIAFSLSMLGAAQATLVLQYDTWPAAGIAVTNTGTSAVPGTLIGNVAGTSYPTGPDDGLLSPPATAAHFDDGAGGGNNLGTGISSNQTLGSLSAGDSSFTMSAWVNLDNTSGDNMVFGTNGGNPMHLGFRGNQAYFGFWGNDSNSAGLGGITGAWNHFTWVWDANGGHQKIYENGVLLYDSAGHGNPGQGGETLTVGTNGNNGGDLAGAIDDARIYNAPFSDAQVATLFTDSSRSDVPEPSSVVLAGLGLIGLLAAYRKRNSRK